MAVFRLLVTWLKWFQWDDKEKSLTELNPKENEREERVKENKDYPLGNLSP